MAWNQGGAHRSPKKEGGKMTDELVLRASDLQKILKRCSQIVVQNSSKSVNHSSSHKNQSNSHDINVLNNQIAELQKKVTSLKKYIKQFEDEKDQPKDTDSTAEEVERCRSSSSDTSVESHGEQLNHCSTWDCRDDEELSLLLVFRYFSVPQLLAVQRVCKKWNRVSQHPLLWQRLVMVDLPISQHVLCKIGEYCSQTTTIHLQGLFPLPAQPEEDLESYISRQKASLEPGLNTLLSHCGTHLTHLTISECSLLFTSRCLWIISKYCSNLKEFVYCSNEFPATAESLWSLANSCTGLRQLHLYPSDESTAQQLFNNHCIQIISNGFPVLSSIMIGGSAITIAGIGILGKSLKNLKEFTIIRGPPFSVAHVSNHITSESFSGLDSLYLIHTRISPQALVKLIETHPNAKTVEVTLSFIDYFPTDFSADAVRQYERIIDNLQALTLHFRYGKVFKLICK